MLACTLHHIVSTFWPENRRCGEARILHILVPQEIDCYATGYRHGCCSKLHSATLLVVAVRDCRLDVLNLQACVPTNMYCRRHMLEDDDVEAVEKVLFGNDADVRQEAAKFLLGDLPAFADVDEELHAKATANAGLPPTSEPSSAKKKGKRRKSAETKQDTEGVDDPSLRSVLHQQFLTILDLCRRHMTAEEVEERITDVVEYAVDAFWGQNRAGEFTMFMILGNKL